MKITQTPRQNIHFSALIKGNEGNFPRERLISLYGSGKAPQGSETWLRAEKLGIALAKENIGITMGAGKNGAMGGIARGLRLAGGYVVGVTTDLIKSFEGISPDLNELHIEPHDNELRARIKKYNQRSRPDVVIAAPGGLGTLDEVVKKWCEFELNAVANKDLNPKEKIILYGNDYWQGLIDWLKGTVKSAGNISQRRLNFLEITDSPQQVIKIIKRIMEMAK